MTESLDEDHLRLLVYRGTGEETIPVADYLDQHRRGGADWAPYLGLVGLDLTVGGKPRWPRISVGDLARMAFQMEAASRRIRQDDLALIRIAVDDFPVGAFFRLRPEGEIVRISLTEVTDPDIAYRYPVDRDGHPVAEVYERVGNAPIAQSGEEPRATNRPELREVAFPRHRLESDLASEAARGRALYDELGQDFDLELY